MIERFLLPGTFLIHRALHDILVLISDQVHDLVQVMIIFDLCQCVQSVVASHILWQYSYRFNWRRFLLSWLAFGFLIITFFFLNILGLFDGKCLIVLIVFGVSPDLLFDWLLESVLLEACAVNFWHSVQLSVILLGLILLIFFDRKVLAFFDVLCAQGVLLLDIF